MPKETPIDETDKIGFNGWGSSSPRAIGASVTFSRPDPKRLLLVFVASIDTVVRIDILDNTGEVVSTESFKASADDEQIGVKAEAPTPDHSIAIFINDEPEAQI